MIIYGSVMFIIKFSNCRIIKLIYSVLKLFTGFINAAFIA